MGYSADKTAYNAAVNADITTQTAPNTIPPEVVGAAHTDFADLLEPYINSINNFGLLFGTGVPSALLGADNDLYFQQTNPIVIYKKLSGAWVEQGELPIDFTLPEGNLTVQTNIDGFTVTASRGGWVIDNTVYQKVTATTLTVDAADLNFYRYDNIYGDALNQILYQVGTASATPVAPTLPANTVLIDQVVVPASSTGFDPYLLYGGSGVNNISIDDVILNQSGGDQLNASFRIDGSGRAEEFIYNDTIKSSHFGLTETFVSPTITGHQGYATDGTYHYIFDTARIDKRNNDGSWSVAISNNTPFAGVAGVSHLGDGDYYSGKLYVPAEIYAGCGSVSGQKIVLYNASTLALDSQFDISAQAHECSSVTIDGANNIAYVSSYCDGSQLWKYNATTFAYLGVLTLSLTIEKIQGISYYNGFIYIASEKEGIYKIDVSTGDATFVKAPEGNFLIAEGLSVVSGQIRWLVDNIGDGTDSSVYYYDPNTTPQGFYTDKAGTSYFGSNLSVGNILSVNTTDKVAAFNLSSSANRLAMYLNSDGNIGAIGHDPINTYLSKNGYYSGGWQRPDVSSASLGVFLNDSSSRIEFRTSAPAVGLTWDTPIWINYRGDLNVKPSLIANVNSDSLVGLDVNPTFTNGAFTSVLNLGARVNANVTASSGLGRLALFTGSVTASANSDVLAGIDVTPTFASGGFSNLLNVGMRISAPTNLTYLAKNPTTTSGAGFAAQDNTGNRLVEFGISNSASTMAASYGVAGEAYIRSGGSTLGLNVSAANGDIKFLTTSSGTLRASITGTSGLFTVFQTQEIKGGAEALKVGTNTANPDHAYIGLYARTATPTTQSAQIGYISAGSNTLSITNSISNGNISISTTGTGNTLVNSPQFIAQLSTDNYRLLVSKTGAVKESSISNNANGVTFQGAIYRGTVGAKTLPLSADKLTRFSGGAYIDSGNTYVATSVSTVATENWVASTNQGAKLEFYTTPNATVAQALALTIDQDKTLINFGGVKNPIRTITATATAAVTDWTILCDATSGAITLNLPSAASAFSTTSGQVYNIKKINNSANNITIDPSGAELIDGAATFTLSTYLQVVTIQSNGTAWYIMS